MIPPRLSFKRIEIRRMPGFPRGGIDLSDLCPGVNVIYGPNASGKTTLGRAIQKLLRPHDPPHEERSLVAWLELDGRLCTIDYDVGRVRFQQDGAEVECPDLAPAEIGDRYVLALHDLIRSEQGTDLAAEIVRQSAGGYDVGEARRALEFRENPARSRPAANDLQAALSQRRELSKRQHDLAQQEAALADLHRQRDQARQAAARLQHIEHAIAWHEAIKRRDDARHEVEAYPPGVAKLVGDEINRLAELRKGLERLRRDRTEAELKVESAERALCDLKLPEGGVAPALVGELRLKCVRLQTLFSEVQVGAKELEQAQAEAQQVRRNLGREVPPQPAEPLDLDAVKDLAEFARRAEQLRADVAAADSLRAWLEPDAKGNGPAAADIASPDLLAEAANCLARWLAASDMLSAAPPRGRVAWRVGAAAGITLVSLLMALVAHLSWLLLLVAAAAVLVWAVVASRLPSHDADPRARWRRQFEELGIAGPASWTADAVRSLQRQLQDRLAAARLGHEKAVKWSDLDARREDLARRLKELREEKSLWQRRLGLALGEAETEAAWLHLLAANVCALHQAEQKRAGAAAKHAEAARQYEELLAEVNAQLGLFGFPAADGPEAASARVEQLDQAAQSHRAASQAVREGTEALKRCDDEIVKLRADEAALFKRLGLAPDQEATLREWVRMHPACREAAESLRLAEHDLKKAEAALADEPEFRSSPLEALLVERDACRVLADKLEEINHQIGQIDNAIAAAKHATELEEALAEEARCRDQLRELRQQDAAAMVGGVLADFLAAQQRERQQPAVFRRARELFVEITHGRYRLDIDLGDPPGFRAFDTAEEVGLSLDELSSGTRLQLLLAVRVAFVEQQERGLKLPLILDETLGNSDERRAQQIIDAAIQICRGGRQVFYFTAQHDEARKWEIMLAQHDDVPRKLLDLAAIRRFSEAERIPPLDFAPPAPPEVPPPDGRDWLAYGKLLEVPRLDPHRELGSIHLWYLIDQPAALYRLLKQGVNLWGQLQALAALGRSDWLAPDSQVYRRAEASARLIDAILRHWRIGRGPPIDRQVLMDSGAVTDKFVDAVADLARQLSGDAKALIAALEEGKVRNFRADKRDQLREYLLARGYLDQRDVLSADEICERVRPLVFADMESGLLSRERFEQLLALIIGAGLPEGPPQ